jgi:hypothetical protein
MTIKYRPLHFALALSLLTTTSVHAQSAEAIQLALDIEKLAQMKQILSEMYDGYKILTEGYNKVKEITSGNFSLHELFLDGLYIVSPEIKKYRKVADIIADQSTILKEYKSIFQQLKKNGSLSVDELTYIAGVYDKLLAASLQGLEELALILTDQKTRMSDDERLQAVDRIYANMKNNLYFLRSFNKEALLGSAQALKEKVDLQTLQNLLNK